MVYGINEKRNEENKEVLVTVKGKMYKKIIGQDRFKGVIDIRGDVSPNLLIDKKKVDIPIIEEGGLISFADYSQPPLTSKSYGYIYMNNDFSELTILVYEMVESGQELDSYKVSYEMNNFIISAPATNREEALNVSNRLIKNLATPFE